MTEQKPKEPYLEFMRVKKFLDPYTHQTTETASTFFVRLGVTDGRGRFIAGCHASDTDIIENTLKDGATLTGYGNLNDQKFSRLRMFCDQITGRGQDPRVLAALNKPNPMEEKVQDAKRAQNVAGK